MNTFFSYNTGSGRVTDAVETTKSEDQKRRLAKLTNGKDPDAKPKSGCRSGACGRRS